MKGFEMTKTTKMKVNSKGGIAVGKMGNGNSVVQNNKTAKKEWSWGVIIAAIITAIGAIIAAGIMAK